MTSTADNNVCPLDHDVSIYLDESGDLGWTLDLPYGERGSSRYLTIAALIVPTEKKPLTEALIRQLYRDRHWGHAREKKWSAMKEGDRIVFAERARDLAEAHPDIEYVAVTVSKRHVAPPMQRDPNLLYNYMIRASLADDMARHTRVCFRPDARTLKIESGNSLHEYLQTTLLYEYGAETELTTVPGDSAESLNIQFADMLSGLVQSHFELRRSRPWQTLKHHIRHTCLLFNDGRPEKAEAERA